jgi:hypothetical protein
VKILLIKERGRGGCGSAGVDGNEHESKYLGSNTFRSDSGPKSGNEFQRRKKEIHGEMM